MMGIKTIVNFRCRQTLAEPSLTKHFLFSRLKKISLMTIVPSRHALLEGASSTIEDEVRDRYLALGTARGGGKKRRM